VFYFTFSSSNARSAMLTSILTSAGKGADPDIFFAELRYPDHTAVPGER
jgi:hypothetical protein